MLNNKAPRPLTVHPTLLAPDGQRRDAPPVIVPAQAFRIVPLAELGALVGTPFQEGSIQLVFQGQNLVLGAQLEMLDAARSVLLTERLSDARVALDTPRLEGVYRLPTGGRSTTHFQVAVANLTDRAVNVTVALDGRDRANLPGAKLALGPREARVLDMRAIEGEKLTPEGGVIITSDARGAVRANGLIWNADGYANTVLFTNPFTPRTTQLHANGIRLQLANGQPLTPYFTLHNFGDEPSRVMGKLFLTLPLDGAQTEALPTVTLPPGATATVPVGLPPGLRGRVVSAGAEFEYSTMPGTVAIAGTSESADGNHVFRVPLLDAETIPSATGSYPWRVTATENTTVYLKNATDRALSYHASLNFPGGQYALGRRMIGAHQTVAIDVRALRDAQTPDATGNVIPREATSGQFLWSVHGVELKSIVGRAEYADDALGVSSHYACYNCCGDSFGTGWIAGPSSIVATETGTYVAYEQYITCYGAWQSPQLAWVTNWSQSGSLASLSPFFPSYVDVTGVTAGAMQVFADWPIFYCDGAAQWSYQASKPVTIKGRLVLQSVVVSPNQIYTTRPGSRQDLPTTAQCVVLVQAFGKDFTAEDPSNLAIVEVFPVDRTPVGAGNLAILQIEPASRKLVVIPNGRPAQFVFTLTPSEPAQGGPVDETMKIRGLLSNVPSDIDVVSNPKDSNELRISSAPPAPPQ